MEILGQIYDHRISSLNVLVELSIGEYYEMSKNILGNSEFQRKRVKASSTVYSLLKTDLRDGCVIPPIVLGIAAQIDKNSKPAELEAIIMKEKDKMIILDGLQRTYTIRDMVNELEEKADPEKNKILDNKLRVEIYIGINKIGILYRMLTLNTGQTPMSSRHQIEIIYSDYLKDGSIEDVKLFREVDGASANNLGEYKFKDIIDGFVSYLDRDYLTLDRIDILDNIKSLEKLAIENQSHDLFTDFLKAYNNFVKKINSISNEWTYNSEEMEKPLSRDPFAQNIVKIFNKSQSLTGFGAAIGKLIDMKVYDSVASINNNIENLSLNNIKSINTMLSYLEDIRNKAAKIGNDQRMFFFFFFKELFDNKSDAFLKIEEAIEGAMEQYRRKTM